jgi:hypothetical protein
MNDEPHLRAAMWNVAFALYMEKNHPEMQDIPARQLLVVKIDPRDRILYGDDRAFIIKMGIESPTLSQK